MTDATISQERVVRARKAIRRAFGDHGLHVAWELAEAAARAALEADADTLTAAKVEGVSAAARDVLAERTRQQFKMGWTPEHDDQHAQVQIAIANPAFLSEYVPGFQPKPDDPPIAAHAKVQLLASRQIDVRELRR